MTTIQVTKTIRPDALLAEVAAALVLPVNPETIFLSLEWEGGGQTMYLHIPDGASQAAAQAAIDAHNSAVVTAGDSAFSTILNLAQSAAGVKLVDLTAAQIKALMAVMLYQVGGVDINTMTVKALGQWVSRR